VKPDAERLSTVPDAPPEAGPDRAFESPPATPLGPGAPEVADVEGSAQPAASPITASVSAAAVIRRPRRFDSHLALTDPAARWWFFMTMLL
jgi:hypothetical protein